MLEAKFAPLKKNARLGYPKKSARLGCLLSYKFLKLHPPRSASLDQGHNTHIVCTITFLLAFVTKLVTIANVGTLRQGA